VIKPCSGGSSVGIAKAENREEYDEAVADAFSYEDEIVVEQFVSGREFSVGVLGDEVLPPIEIIPTTGFYDYKAKYQAGLTIEKCPAEITEAEDNTLRDAAMRAFKTLRLGSYARIDFILDENGDAYCLEANTLPGMTPTSLLPQEAAAIGIDYPTLCEKIVELSLRKYK
ncbi:MAG: ATP-grasp domain-containing protein, partial [Ruminococcus sp.]|nr:ATP-grasp domain-containing protein [Ruminococcus sp.]